jgi:hypothetical protein
MSVIDEALSADATMSNDYDPGRGRPPAPRIAIVNLRRSPAKQHRADAGSR